ncbi:hypothetical protein WJX84_011851 [Apatococcus fuscideae]|uniref:Glutamyl-tRNA reductase n=1 Tax=Apatococcus fuscideae TaxID=2026836 RepID=A0AAW1S623_9CHLO
MLKVFPAAGVTSVKLPPTHLEASQRALDDIRASSIGTPNRYTLEKKSSLIAVGLTVHSTPVDVREKLSIPEAEWPRAIEELVAFPHIEEAAILSTCNRMELYVVALSYHRGMREVKEWMSKSSSVPLEQLEPHMFAFRDGDAAEHLLRVAGGLESLVMGEGQILAQVKNVYSVGQNVPGFGRQLNGLFKQAITAGKRVRSETTIASGAVSVSSAAAELAQLKLPSHKLADARICIIGAGKMSRLLVKHLDSKGCGQIILLNRSLPRAHALAEEFPTVAFSIRLMSELMQSVAESDLVFAASGSEDILINKEDIQDMPAATEAVGSLRRFVDISVPRNIASDISSLEAAAVYNVDDLKEVVAANIGERQKAAAEARELLREEQQMFEGWRDSLATVPTIKALRNKAEAIRTAEFEKALARLGDGLTKKQARAVEELSKGIVNKLLHGPMTALRLTLDDMVRHNTEGPALTQSLIKARFELSKLSKPVLHKYNLRALQTAEDSDTLLDSIAAVGQLPDDPHGKLASLEKEEGIFTLAVLDCCAYEDELSMQVIADREGINALLQQQSLGISMGAERGLEEIDTKLQQAILSFASTATAQGEVSVEQLSGQIEEYTQSKNLLCMAVLPAFEVQQAKWEKDLTAALQLMAVQMIEAAVIRAAMQDLVTLLLAEIQEKAAQAREAGQESMMTWRQSRTQHLLDSRKTTLQSPDFASLPQLRAAIASIGAAQRDIRQVGCQQAGSDALSALQIEVAAAARDQLAAFQKESQEIHPERPLELLLEEIQSAASEDELDGKAQQIVDQKTSLASQLEARHQLLIDLLQQLQQQLAREQAAGFGVLFSLEDEARQFLPKQQDGQPLMDLDPLVSVDGLGEAIKLWQVAFLERAMNAADLASTAMIASSTEATACSSALMEALLDKMSGQTEHACGNVKKARIKELKAQQRSLARHISSQARVRVAHHKAQAKTQAQVEKEMEASLKLLRGLQEQLGSCQSPPSLGLICRRAQFLKEKIDRTAGDGLQAARQQADADQQGLVESSGAFKASLQPFELGSSGWAGAGLEAAAVEMAQDLATGASACDAALAEATARFEVLKAEAGIALGALETAAPAHRRDLIFIETLERACHTARKNCTQVLGGSHKLGLETTSALQELRDKLRGAQGQRIDSPAATQRSAHKSPRARSPRSPTLEARVLASTASPTELMAAAEKLRGTLLRQVVNLDMLGSTSLASTTGDEQMGASGAGVPASMKGPETAAKASKAAAATASSGPAAAAAVAAAKLPAGAAAGPVPGTSPQALMQQAEQELAACTEAVRKACAMYYNPLASEAKPAAGQSKAKATTLEAPRSVLLSSDGPGAITRPAAIMANAADMEERCANDMAVVRSGAQLQVKQASEVLMTQVEQAEKLLLQLPGAVLGQLAAEVGGAAQSELHALLAQLLKELVAAMQPAAANRDALSPIMARPSRTAELAELQTREQERAAAAQRLIREHARVALQAVAAQAGAVSLQLEQQAMALMALLNIFPLLADLAARSPAPVPSAIAAPVESASSAAKTSTPLKAMPGKEAGGKVAAAPSGAASGALRPFEPRVWQAESMSKEFSWGERARKAFH